MGKRGPKARDRIGERFGMLTIEAIDRQFNPPIAMARCDCGGTYRGDLYCISGGGVRSCGCLRRERGKELAKVYRFTGDENGSFRHGRYQEPEYECWRGMIRRCTKPNNPSWKYYGGQGIRVCDRWLHGDGNLSGLECFIADMGRKPSATHSIDRINNAGNYEPGNCRWATRSEQARNQRPGGRFGSPERMAA